MTILWYYPVQMNFKSWSIFIYLHKSDCYFCDEYQILLEGEWLHQENWFASSLFWWTSSCLAWIHRQQTRDAGCPLLYLGSRMPAHFLYFILLWHYFNYNDIPWLHRHAENMSLHQLIQFYVVKLVGLCSLLDLAIRTVYL